MLLLLVVTLMLITMLLNLNTGLDENIADLCIRITSFCCNSNLLKMAFTTHVLNYWCGWNLLGGSRDVVKVFFTIPLLFSLAKGRGLFFKTDFISLKHMMIWNQLKSKWSFMIQIQKNGRFNRGKSKWFIQSSGSIYEFIAQIK